MAIVRLTFWVLLFMLLYSVASKVSEGDHFEILPLVPNTPLMQGIIKTQTVIWCVDARASNYPNFVAQVKDVKDQYKDRVGIKHRQVGFSDSTCIEKHTMPDNFTCGAGAAACIYYWQRPVIIEYNYRLGFINWKSAIGHELGHGELGLHEQYIDRGSIQCDRTRTDTVMSCGTGIEYPSARDILIGCSLISTSWCGKSVSDPRGPKNVIGKDGVTVLHWGACNSLDQRFTSDIRQHYPDGTTSSGVIRPGGSVADFTGRMGFTRVPSCP
jgi:hypothetical protein